MDIRLLLIDAQKDFCDPDTGSLYVSGAENDCDRVSTMIGRLGKKITRIHATLDQHHPMAIFHPMFWIDSSGTNPDPFTIISVDDLANSRWRTRAPQFQDYAEHYVGSLESGSRYPLCIWPYHCLIGSPGAAVMPSVFTAMTEWEQKYFRMVEYISKGSNYKTEHYSAVKAEVPDPEDPVGTNLNQTLIETLEEADMILLAGQAKSHCLANTVRDVADNFSDPVYIKKLYLLEDSTSSVTGFEQLGVDFQKEMIAKGMNVTTTTEVLA